MRAQISLLCLPILMISLASCDDPGPARAAIAVVLSKSTPAARRAEIRRQIAAVCPRPLDADEAEWAAQYVEQTRTKGAAWIAGRLLQFNRETALCRGV